MTESKATRLVEMALQQFRVGCDLDGKPFAVEHDGPNVALALRGRGGLRSALAHAFYASEGQAPGQNPLTEAMTVVEGMAMVAPREPVAVRMGEHRGRIVVDLARTDGKAVVIDGSGWQVEDRSPVLFRSTEVIGSLPLPVEGGSLDELAALVNVSDADLPVLYGFLVAAMFYDLAHPVLFFSGEQGTAKSWATRLVVRTFDGADADVQCVPRNLDDWSVLAASSWSVALDNVSKIDPWFSDALCRASTGARTLKRSLYSDDNVAVLRVKRVLALNGIDPEVAGGDLAERLIRFDLEPVNGRVTDEEIEVAFRESHSGVLGALCDLVAAVQRRLPQTQVSEPPRMASFAKILAAVDAELGSNGLDRYREMVRRQVAQTTEASVFVQTLVRVVADGFEGTAGDLLKLLRSDTETDRDDLPKTPQAVGSSLSRVGPSLRAQGWTVAPGRTGRARQWKLLPPDRAGRGTRGARPSQPSQQTFGGDDGDVSDGHRPLVPLSTFDATDSAENA